jgi:hypothetical protein
MQCTGSVTFLNGPYHGVTDPDPALFFSGFQDANKNKFLFLVFLLITTGSYKKVPILSY